MKKHAEDAGHSQPRNLRDKGEVLRHGQTRHSRPGGLTVVFKRQLGLKSNRKVHVSSSFSQEHVSTKIIRARSVSEVVSAGLVYSKNYMATNIMLSLHGYLTGT